MASIASLISLADGGQTVWRQIPHSTRSSKLSRQWRRNWEATQPTVSYQGIDGEIEHVCRSDGDGDRRAR